jgi:hypothetical protein
MKITGSTVTMASTHQEISYSYKESMTIEAAASKDVDGAILSLSEENESQSYLDSMSEYKKKQQEEAEETRKNNENRALQKMAESIKNQKSGGQLKVSDEYQAKIEMLRQMLAALRGEKTSPYYKRSLKNGILDLRSSTFQNLQEPTSTGITVGTTATGTTWQRITATSGFATEAESTTFASTGLVTTADGRSIDFNIEVSMSRAFVSKIDSLEVQNYIKTDPLMINLDTNIGSVSDQKFFFDLDADGTEENISFAGQGSGFLALDKNGDGKINDGSELFGTKSGDGFRDLAAYDEDGNGWIDENDSVFSQLKVWTKDENGNDILMDLKQADVGAIYLDNADTQFSLKNDENQLNAEIKKTGVYLKESTGSVGTLNHVDLVV